MKIEKLSANYSIIDSGTIMTFDGQSSLQIKIMFENHFKLILQIKFQKEDKSKRDIKLSADIRTNTINILCINFDNLLGTGTTVPIEIATYQGKKIFLHFWVYSLGTSSIKKVDYCVYREG